MTKKARKVNKRFVGARDSRGNNNLHDSGDDGNTNGSRRPNISAPQSPSYSFSTQNFENFMKKDITLQ